MEVRMTTGTDDDDHCRTTQPDSDHADVPFVADRDGVEPEGDEDGYGFGV